jgi:hypothetical protein
MNDGASDRDFLLRLLAKFAAAARNVPGVVRIAVIGSLTTEKLTPKDADALVTVRDNADFQKLALIGRKMKGAAQTRGRGADIFLANENGQYIGRTCSFKECHPRVACRGSQCSQGAWICNDFDEVRLSPELIANPPVVLWPQLQVRQPVPMDLQKIVIKRFESASNHNAA